MAVMAHDFVKKVDPARQESHLPYRRVKVAEGSSSQTQAPSHADSKRNSPIERAKSVSCFANRAFIDTLWPRPVRARLAPSGDPLVFVAT